MNERIKQLAEQAAKNYTGTFKWEYLPDIDKKIFEKFAELIVRECVQVCNKIYFERYPDAEDFERSEEGDAIKKHFGVEE